MTTRPATPPDFLDCDPPGLGDDDSPDDNVLTPWDVLARWHREDGFVVDGITPTVAGFPRGGAAPNDDIRPRRETRDERHRRRGWTLSLRDGGPPPGVRATVCALAWTTARWHRFAPNRVSHRVTAWREETRRGAPAEASAARSACDAWTPWETTHAIAVAALTEAFERRVLSLSNPSDRIRKRAATKAAAAAGDALAIAAARVSLASRPSDSTDGTRRGTRWDALTVANVALRAIERTRAKARAIARLASQPPARARAIRATRRRREGERGSRATPGERSTRDSGGSSKLPAWAACITSARRTPENKRACFRRRPRWAFALLCLRFSRGAPTRAARRRGAKTAKTRAPSPKPEPKPKRSGAADRSKVRAKVIASPTPRRALGDASNRRSMFSPVSPGAGSPAPARSRRAGARR